MSKRISANTKARATQQRAAKLRPQTWKKGQPSPNPAGAPKRGESWAEIIQRIGEMTDAEFVKLKHTNPTQKQQAIMAIYMALKNDPQPGVFNAIMDRTEGKVAQPVTVEPSAALFAKLQELGLTLNDVRSDPLAVELFRLAGVAITSASEVGTDRGEENNGL